MPERQNTVSTVLSREQKLFLAELAGEAERYEDVVIQIKTIMEDCGSQLTIDERNLLSVAYKSMTNKLRNSWRIIDNIQRAHASHSTSGVSTRQRSLLAQQQRRVEKELAEVCREIVTLIDIQLLPVAKPGEETIFYSKMKGDYYRYLAEFANKSEREHYSDLSLGAYKSAYKNALEALDALHPTRLGLGLNFSVFYHDIRKSPERACHLAKSAFDDAILSLDPSEVAWNESFRDSLTILQLLRDNLILWHAECMGFQRCQVFAPEREALGDV